LFVAAGECVLLLWRQNRTLSGAKFSFKKFMVTIANASLLCDLELRREQELAEARAYSDRNASARSVANR
jgi:hypothetical protein